MERRSNRTGASGVAAPARQRLAVVAASSLVLAACAAHPAPPVLSRRGGSAPPAEAPPTGTFTARHTVATDCGAAEPCEEVVRDELSIEPVADGGLAISVEVIRDHGHTCSFAGRLAPDPADRARWRFLAGADDEDGPCELVLIRTPDHLELVADGCRYYCGARAYLDGTYPIPGA